jgi:hypothetical protein
MLVYPNKEKNPGGNQTIEMLVVSLLLVDGTLLLHLGLKECIFSRISQKTLDKM